MESYLSFDVRLISNKYTRYGGEGAFRITKITLVGAKKRDLLPSYYLDISTESADNKTYEDELVRRIRNDLYLTGANKPLSGAGSVFAPKHADISSHVPNIIF